jgi:hypothetical protein
LRTLQFFYDGILNGREFALKFVEPQFEGLTYKTLSDDQRRLLDNTSFNATIVRQQQPAGHESIFLIFERINSGGTSLTAQEIRSALYPDEFQTLLKRLNLMPTWREIFGEQPSARMKDQELILRFFALLHNRKAYKRPMKSFLTDFMKSTATFQMALRRNFPASSRTRFHSFPLRLGAAHSAPKQTSMRQFLTP